MKKVILKLNLQGEDRRSEEQHLLPIRLKNGIIRLSVCIADYQTFNEYLSVHYPSVIRLLSAKNPF